jgi:flagellar hook protein FlgE
MDAALQAATSALQAQSKALSIISDNLANSSTTGYKAVDTSFSSLIAGETTSVTDTTGGVSASGKQNIDVQGLISSTDTSTDMAIDGNGMFVVSDGLGGATYYTRDGAFQTDANGYLEVNGYYLMGWPTDSSGNITATDTNSTGGLEAIDVNRFSSEAAATQNITLQANLPADATAGSTFTTSLEAYDSLGVEEDIPVTWTKSSTANEWTMTVADPTNASTGDQSGTVGGSTSYTVDFNSDGSLGSITDASGNTVSAATVTISSWNDGANTTTDGSITLDLGTASGTDGLTQYASGETDPQISIENLSKDGVAYGTLSSVSVSSDGTVTAKYSNGQSMAIYKVAVATFQNVDGLAAKSDDVYQQTSASGNYALHVAGTDGAGVIDGSALEGSTTDTSTEFSKMIVAQQAYSAASQIISTDKSMFSSLMNAMG